MFRLPQHLALPVCTAAVLAGALAPAVANAEEGDRSAVAVRFADRCDGGADVEAPNPYTGRNLVFKINESVVVVGPGQRHLEHVPAPTGDGELVVKVEVHDQDDAVEQTVHYWSRPPTCSTGREAGGDDDAGTDGGYGPASGAVAGVDGPAAAGIGSAVSAAGQAEPVAASGETGPDLAAAAAGPGVAGAGAGSDVAAAGGLPVTGANVIELASLGVTLLAGGLALVRIRRQRIRFDAR
ncbi:LPXTG cell wall anchor domain-containing protein [Dactylosporangium sp. NPDC051541]|uniref:LPXTG cell wall anchor domain-containing protein n=1 Tax=Dactylosporangium sp. NPDC051541 TaxID=3363977 RepID=UPI0037AD9D0A